MGYVDGEEVEEDEERGGEEEDNVEVLELSLADSSMETLSCCQKAAGKVMYTFSNLP